MTDASHDTSRGQEWVVDLATISLKESLAALFRCWDAAVHRTAEDPEHVHQLRIESRRVAAALQLFADFLPRRRTERLLRELDTLRKSAGTARDCDVFAKRLANIPGDQAAIQFAEHLREQRSDAQRALVAYYEQCGRGEFLEQQATDLLATLRPRGGHAKAQPTQVGNWASRQLRSAVREFFANSKVDAKQLKRLHQFRIRVKQFRYGLEVLQRTLPADQFKKACGGLKKLSQRLGEINDHATAVETLTDWLNGDFDREVHRALRRWRKDERRALRRAVSEFADWWSPRRKRLLRRRLKDVTRVNNSVSATE